MWSSLEPDNPIFTIKTMNNMFYYANKYFDTLSEESIEKLQNLAEKVTCFILRPLGHWLEEHIECICSSKEEIVTYLTYIWIRSQIF